MEGSERSVQAEMSIQKADGTLHTRVLARCGQVPSRKV